MIGWFDEWQSYRVLPYGSPSLNDEPAIVFDVISVCSETTARVMAEQNNV